MSNPRHDAKLAKLIEIEGYDSIEALMEAVFSDSVSPAICMNEGCDYTCEMEPDQRRGWCDECRTDHVNHAILHTRTSCDRAISHETINLQLVKPAALSSPTLRVRSPRDDRGGVTP